jgi:hypothetical protein
MIPSWPLVELLGPGVAGSQGVRDTGDGELGCRR